jgi:hypothetical protein
MLPLESGSRVVVAALVPAAGDEDKPLRETVERAVANANGIVVGTLVQRRGVSRSRNPGGAQSMHRRYPMQKATLLGKGKVVELIELVHQSNAGYVLFCNWLTKKQKATLESLTGARVISVFPDSKRP